jgi:hypothetical protein
MSVYRPINWSPNEVVGEEKMDIFTSNLDYLYKNTPRAVYTIAGLTRVEGVRIASGRVNVAAASSDTANYQVRFGNFFSTGCQPNITTGLVSTGTQLQVFCTLSGIGQVLPDSTGFNVTVNIASPNKSTDTIRNTVYVMWEAMGY